MSGREGAAEARGRMGSLQALCRGLLAAWRSRDAGHESSWLWDGRRRVVGIAEASGGRALLFAELLAEGESYQLVRTAKEQLAGDVTMAEAAAMRAERDGWQALDFAICLSDEVVRFYEMELPPHMEGDEWREAAHWELDARLMAEGLDADAYAMAYRRQGEASVLLAAAEHQYLEGIQAGFASQGIALRGMVALAPDDGSDEALLAAHGLELLPAQRMFLPAIAAALAALSDEPVLSLRLWGEMIPRRHFRYRRLAALCCAVTFLILFAAAFFDTRAYFEAKRDCEREEQALALLQRDEKTMRMTAKLQQEIQQRDAKAAHLVGGAMPWYSVMVHLGWPELQTEGVWLKSVALRQDKKIEIRGAALSYGALSSFLQSFEADRDFFPQGPILEESAEETGAEKPGIAFRISLGI